MQFSSAFFEEQVPFPHIPICVPHSPYNSTIYLWISARLIFLAFKNHNSQVVGFLIFMFNDYSEWRKYMTLYYAILAFPLINRWWFPHEVCTSSAQPLCLIGLTFWFHLLIRLFRNVCNIHYSIKIKLVLEARKVIPKIFKVKNCSMGAGSHAHVELCITLSIK
jgi:hypothetical protein